MGTGQAKQPSWASPVTFHPSSGSEMGASAPPVSTQSRRHDSICRTEYAMASVEEVQQVVMTWLAPFRAKRQFNSLESDPITPVGIQNRLILLVWPLNKRRYVSSVNSCDPPPVSHDDAKAPPFFKRQRSGFNARTGQCLGRSAEREREYARNVLALFFLHSGEFVEFGNFSGDLDFDGG